MRGLRVAGRTGQRRIGTALRLGTGAFAVAALVGCGQGEDPATTGVTPGAEAKPVNATALTLSDKGAGPLLLNMTTAQAQATGLLGEAPEGEDGVFGDCKQYRGKNGVESVYMADDRVVIISVTSKVGTDRGVKVGDTLESVRKAYPDMSYAEGLGRTSIPAPGAPFPAHYRVGIDESDAMPTSKVTELALQADAQPCYE